MHNQGTRKHNKSQRKAVGMLNNRLQSAPFLILSAAHNCSTDLLYRTSVSHFLCSVSGVLVCSIVEHEPPVSQYRRHDM